MMNSFKGSNKEWIKVAASLLAAGVTLYIGHQLLCPAPSPSAEVSETAVTVTLMAHEQVTMAMMPGVTTITKLKCCGVSPETFLRRKVGEMLVKNPWLAGRLKINETDGLHLVYEPTPKKITPDYVANLVQAHFQVIEHFDLPEGLTYEALEKKFAHLQVKSGNNCANKEELLFRVSLLHVKDRDEVVLVFSVSHVLADGFTFYQLHRMLDRTTPVVALEVVRSTRYEMEIQRLTRKVESVGPAMILGMLGCTLLRRPMNMYVVKVDNAWLAEQKAAFLARKASVGDTCTVEFVSTNDILTAWHNRHCQSDLSLMSINCRTRCAFKEHWAGNYEHHIVYNTPSDGHTPEAVRRSLQTYRNASDTLPGFLKTLAWNGSLATNWCTNYQEIDISDASVGSKCEHMLHLPVICKKDWSGFREGVCIFKMDANTTGLLLFTRILTPEQVESTGVGSVIKSM